MDLPYLFKGDLFGKDTFTDGESEQTLPIDGPEGYGRASFDARDREPLGGISGVEDLDYDEAGSIGENSECSPQRGIAKSPETINLGKS